MEVGTEPTITLQMHDHENGDSCACMEENKQSDIKTIFSYQAPLTTDATICEKEIKANSNHDVQMEMSAGQNKNS